MEQSKIAKIDETIEFLNKLGFPVDKSLFERCDPEVISELYISLLERLQIIKRDNLKLEIQGMQFFEYTGMHDKAICLIKLSKYVDRFMRDILKVNDFTSQDIFNPVPKRTKTFIGRIVKFYKFKLAQREAFNELQAKVVQTTKSREDAERNEKAIDDKISALKKAKEDEKPEKERIENNIMNYENETKENNQKILLAREELEQLKQKGMQIDQSINVIDDLHVNYSNSISNLEKQIVSSPEKMLTVLDESEKANDLLNQGIQSQEELINKRTTLYSNLEILQKINKEFIESYSEKERADKEKGEIEKDVNVKKEVIAQKKKIYDDLKYQLENISIQLSNLNTYSVENARESGGDRQIREKELNDYRNKAKEHEQSLTEIKKLISQLEGDCKVLVQAKNEIQKIKVDYEKEMTAKMQALVNIARTYTESIMKSFQLN